MYCVAIVQVSELGNEITCQRVCVFILGGKMPDLFQTFLKIKTTFRMLSYRYKRCNFFIYKQSRFPNTLKLRIPGFKLLAGVLAYFSPIQNNQNIAGTQGRIVIVLLTGFGDGIVVVFPMDEFEFNAFPYPAFVQPGNALLQGIPFGLQFGRGSEEDFNFFHQAGRRCLIEMTNIN